MCQRLKAVYSRCKCFKLPANMAPRSGGEVKQPKFWQAVLAELMATFWLVFLGCASWIETHRPLEPGYVSPEPDDTWWRLSYLPRHQRHLSGLPWPLEVSTRPWPSFSKGRLEVMLTLLWPWPGWPSEGLALRGPWLILQLRLVKRFKLYFNAEFCTFVWIVRLGHFSNSLML